MELRVSRRPTIGLTLFLWDFGSYLVPVAFGSDIYWSVWGYIVKAFTKTAISLPEPTKNSTFASLKRWVTWPVSEIETDYVIHFSNFPCSSYENKDTAMLCRVAHDWYRGLLRNGYQKLIGLWLYISYNILVSFLCMSWGIVYLINWHFPSVSKLPSR